MSVIHIFKIPQVIELALGNGGALMNYPVNRTDFRLFRHVDNQIDLWVKNIDHKAVSMANTTVTMHIKDPDTDRVLLTRDLTVVDSAKGLLKLFVSGDDVAALPEGAFKYSTVITNTITDAQTLLFTDMQRRATGTVEIVEGPTPDPQEPIVLNFYTFTQRSGKYYSGAQPGAATVKNYSGLHTLAVGLYQFTGTITVQGTLQEVPSALDVDWFDVDSRTYNNQTGLFYFPFEGNLLWVRLKIEVFSGTIESLEYRN